jgi:hypothetical protein
MPNWKFWEKPIEPVKDRSPESAAPRRFSARPRTDLIDPYAVSDPTKAAQLSMLRNRRETVLFDLEQAELALQPENPWRDRVALLDEALAAVQSDRERVRNESEPAGRPVPATPIEEIATSEGPPPSVSFRIGDQRFHYEEDIDWAERGFQLARSELQPLSGDPAGLVPHEFPEADQVALRDHLTDSLFAFASDLRDRMLAGQDPPTTVTLADLARPDETNGGWYLWGGASPAAQRKQHRLQELASEEQRLYDERKQELDELARLADRLPIARRRLADVDAEIAAFGV